MTVFERSLGCGAGRFCNALAVRTPPRPTTSYALVRQLARLLAGEPSPVDPLRAPSSCVLLFRFFFEAFFGSLASSPLLLRCVSALSHRFTLIFPEPRLVFVPRRSITFPESVASSSVGVLDTFMDMEAVRFAGAGVGRAWSLLPVMSWETGRDIRRRGIGGDTISWCLRFVGEGFGCFVRYRIEPSSISGCTLHLLENLRASLLTSSAGRSVSSSTIGTLSFAGCGVGLVTTDSDDARPNGCLIVDARFGAPPNCSILFST